MALEFSSKAWTIACIGFAIGLSCAVTRAQEQSLPPLTTQPAGMATPLSEQSSVRIDRILFEGNTIFTAGQLLLAPTQVVVQEDRIEVQKRVRDYLGKDLTLEDLEAIRVAITLYYINGGDPDPASAGTRYVNSGAIIPDQEVGPDHTIRIQVVEGKLNRPTVQPLKHLRQSYIASRLERAAQPALDRTKLRDQLELLRQNPNIERINAELAPGEQTGLADLDVSIVERRPWQDGLIGKMIIDRSKKEYFPWELWQVGLSFNNHRSPSVGAERLELIVQNQNLLGFSDSLSLEVALTNGGIDDAGIAGFEEFSLDYALPLNSVDTTLMIGVSRSDSPVVEEPFDELDINSETERVYALLRQPLRRTPNSEFAVFGGLQYQTSTTTLLGDPYSLSPGAVDGKTDVTSIRFGGEYFTRDTQQAFSVRSTVAVGIDAFDATVDTDDDADAQFVSWLTQLQYVRRLGGGGTQGVFRMAAQLTPDSLPATEQFALGGVDTVRGYRENELVRDNAVTGSLELHVPILTRENDDGTTVNTLEGICFLDAGYGWNKTNEPDGEYLISVGLGAVYTPTKYFNAQLFWGIPLNDVNDESDDLQDYGIHFNIVLQLF